VYSLLGLIGAIGAMGIASPAAGAATTTAGNRAADVPILADIEKTYPSATEVFVNCAIAVEMSPDPNEEFPGGPGYQCEFRVVSAGQVIKGQDEVVADPEREHHYLLTNVAVEEKGPDRWRSCGFEATGIPKASALKVLVRGSSCGSLAYSAFEEIRGLIYGFAAHGDRLVPMLLPSRFAVGDTDEDAGFLVNRFRCRGRNQFIGRARMKQSATCATKFGDAIEVSLEQPRPPRRRA
jgi:hypothetical protein